MPVYQPIHILGLLFFSLSLLLTASLVPVAQISACVGWGCLSSLQRWCLWLSDQPLHLSSPHNWQKRLQHILKPYPKSHTHLPRKNWHLLVFKVMLLVCLHCKVKFMMQSILECNLFAKPLHNNCYENSGLIRYQVDLLGHRRKMQRQHSAICYCRVSSGDKSRKHWKFQCHWKFCRVDNTESIHALFSSYHHIFKVLWKWIASYHDYY